MNSTRSLLIILITVAICITAISCGKNVRAPGGQMDDPPTHCKQGMKYWDEGKFAQAEEEFKLAQSLDPKYAPAYSGLALTTAHNAKQAPSSDSAKKLFKEAIKLADKAQALDGKDPAAFIAKGLVITMRNEGIEAKKWLKDVEKEYNKAIKLDPENAEAYYRRGYCYKKAYAFKKAADDFRKVLDLKKGFTEPANMQWKIVQQIERAAPGTDVGKKIALVEQITRADIAALFVSELKIDKLIDKKAQKNYDTDFAAPQDRRELTSDTLIQKAAITDIDNHWAKNFINDIAERNIRGLEPYPDHTFHPDQLINRGEYALMVEDALIVITGNQDLATKHIGTESRFPDVNASHPAYNAICNAVDKGVMDADMNGAFGLEKPVSGPEALLVIRKLKELNKIE